MSDFILSPKQEKRNIQIIKVMTWLYHDKPTLFLDRKKQKYINAVGDIIENTKRINVQFYKDAIVNIS